MTHTCTRLRTHAAMRVELQGRVHHDIMHAPSSSVRCVISSISCNLCRCTGRARARACVYVCVCVTTHGNRRRDSSTSRCNDTWEHRGARDHGNAKSRFRLRRNIPPGERIRENQRGREEEREGEKRKGKREERGRKREKERRRKGKKKRGKHNRPSRLPAVIFIFLNYDNLCLYIIRQERQIAIIEIGPHTELRVVCAS